MKKIKIQNESFMQQKLYIKTLGLCQIYKEFCSNNMLHRFEEGHFAMSAPEAV
jgi:hypothetical protein